VLAIYNLRLPDFIRFRGGVRLIHGVLERSLLKAFMVGVAALAASQKPARAQIDTNLDNFFLKGTQPQQNNPNFEGFVGSQDCGGCHANFDGPRPYDPLPIFNNWQGSMKANATRDPMWRASLAIANQDAPSSGDLCIRCHSPAGWVSGRSTPTDGSLLGGEFGQEFPADMEGVTCTVCHRMVDPVARPENPDQDDPIRNALINAGMLPTSPGSGNYIIDPTQVARGPYPFVPGGPNPYPNVKTNLMGFPIIHSPFHKTSELCATCHDVSNPALTRQPDGTYTPNDTGVAHASQSKFDMFPLERTFSEWANSQYASLGVQANGVFGGNHPTGVMHTCQDCHMPDVDTFGCNFESAAYHRPDVPSHDFSGGNAWVQDMIANLYPSYEVEPQNLMAAKERAIYMLQNAATLEVTEVGCDINVRIINETGHKLPTGYPEGRRMWISVDFLDENLGTVASRGYYHSSSADLNVADTKVYESVLGLDASMAAASGVAEGPSSHFVLNNKVYKDNRIPPRGFTNAAFASVQAVPVAASYADGQYWDDTRFRRPPGAVSATVSIYYQTSSREYIEFLRDENFTNDAGEELYAQWLFTGMSPPVLMKQMVVPVPMAGLFADADCSGAVNLRDTASLDECLTGPFDSLILGCEAFDADLDGDVDLKDVRFVQSAFDP
jgi:hypothetical protein